MKILIKYLVIFSIPFLVLTIIYAYKDPFKILKYYDSYYKSNQINSIYLNKDHISTQNLINKTENHSSSYNSFILGNSKTVFLNTKKWSTNINESENNCYHFDASAETLIGIKNKLVFLDKNNYNLKNVLISLDYSTLKKVYLGDRQLNVNSYLNTEEISKYYFQYIHLKTFFNAKFLFPYLIYISNGEIPLKFMYSFKIFDEKKITYNSITNELRYPEIDSLIYLGLFHNNIKLTELPETNEDYYESIISNSQVVLLNEIKTILAKHNSSFVIIIPPSYDKLKFSNNDITKLEKIFGKKFIYDFSGENFITRNKKLYYEQTHFIPKVWDIILDSIANSNTNIHSFKLK